MSTTSISGANLDLGRVIQVTFGVIGRNLPTFLLLSIIFAGLPAMVLGAGQLTLLKPRVEATVAPFTVMLVGWLVALIGTYILQGALTHGALSDLNGRRASLGACLATGLTRLLPLIGLAIVMTIALMFGFILLVFPALMMLTAWAAAVPALVAERRGVFEAFGRSAALTRGHRWMILVLLIIVLVANWIVGFVIALPFGVLAGATGAAWAPYVQTLVVMPLINAVQGLIGATGAAVLYFELRRIKEGVGVEDLASVFD